MHVVDTRAYLNEEIEGCVFREVLFFPNQIKQVAFAGVFKSKIDRLFIFKAGIQAADVFMVQLLLNSDFANQRLFYFV